MSAGEVMTELESGHFQKIDRSGIHDWPSIVLVTAAYNAEPYIEEAICSVLQQRYPNLEYYIVDGASSDGTIEIIKKYENQISGWISEPDRGVYDAINKGFAQSTGQIMGWLNANDKLHADGLYVVGSVFRTFPDVDWITGRPTVFSDSGMTVEIQDLPHWSRERFLAGANRHIQQESTFWRRGLWEKAGGSLEASYRAEGDFELWVRFFRLAQLYPVDALIGGWRFHPGSLSHADVDRYNQSCDRIIEEELRRTPGNKSLVLFRQINSVIQRIPKVRGVWQRLVMDNLSHLLYRMPGRDWPPTIEYQGDKWAFRKK